MLTRVNSHVVVDRHGVLRRRDFLRSIAAGGTVLGLSNWGNLMQAHADTLRQQGMSCILLWMSGGPSQFETFDPKPGHENGGETKAIESSVPGIHIAENFPRLAQSAGDLAILRSLTSKEGSHPRASFLLHTGYLPTASVKHPTLGALVAQQLGRDDCALPAFVRIGNRGRNDGGAGLLGVDYDPFALNEADAVPPNTRPATDVSRYERRLSLVERLDAQYALRGARNEAADHQKLYRKTSRMILSPQMSAFDLDQEPDSMREAYGRTKFGNACLLARRLVEAGVTFVEVVVGGWDTHQDNFAAVKKLAGEVDQPFAHLLADLKTRGRLNNTLIVWMGEFGRTPRINPRGGRDHYPRAFNAVLAGGGIRGGQVVGATDASGSEVAERPIAVTDLFQTFCRSLKMNADHENMSPIGRPIPVVDGGKPVDELFS